MNSRADAVTIIIGDNSGFSRLVLSDILNAVPGIEVLDTATDGEELLEKVKRYRPGLVIADDELPRNSRLFTFSRIAAECPTPILMLTRKEAFSADFLDKIMAVGVYDIIRKPNSMLHPNFRQIAREIIDKVKNVVNPSAGPLVLLKNRRTLFPKAVSNLNAKPKQQMQEDLKLIVIGGSTGGTKALETVARGLDAGLKAVVLIAVHLPEQFTRSFASRLQELTELQVLEGREETELKERQIIIAPGGRNMIVEADKRNKGRLVIGFSDEEVSEFDQPSVDLLMKSVAMLAGENSLGVILTGMGYDGTLGARYILRNGGITIAQNEESSVIFGMAKSAIGHGLIKEVIDLAQISEYINNFVKQ